MLLKMLAGMAFFKENIDKLANENPEHMPIGFEVAFPSLLEKARNINLEVPDNSPVLQEIYARRDLKLTRYINYYVFCFCHYIFMKG